MKEQLAALESWYVDLRGRAERGEIVFRAFEVRREVIEQYGSYPVVFASHPTVNVRMEYDELPKRAEAAK